MKTLLLLLLGTAGAGAATLKAGFGRAEITPAGSIWMSGYAARTHASDGVMTPLWAKALAIESEDGGRIVMVSADIVGVPGVVTEEAARRLKKQFGLKRAEFMVNASHTHSGPMLWPNLSNLTVFPAEEQTKFAAYQARFTDAVTAAAGAAIGDLSPATIEYGEGSAGFAVNRRVTSADGARVNVNRAGPVDHTVPVLKVTGTDGRLRGVLFGYACHNTTIGPDVYEVNGDYSGFATAKFEQQHPGTTAVFLMLCGADQNPNPRGKVEQARQYGDALAAEVERVMGGSLKRLDGRLRTEFLVIRLQLARRTRQELEAERKSTLAAAVRRVEMMLKRLDEGKAIDRIDYPLQAIRFGNSLTVLALGGEVVVDYALRAKREYGGEALTIAGYANDVMCYIPSARVLGEGGYEANDSMIYYAQAGPFAADVEERVFAGIRRVMKGVGR